MATSIATFLQTFFYKCWVGKLGWDVPWGGTVVWEFYRYRPVKTMNEIWILFIMASIMGAIGGCAGSLFIAMNTWSNILRRRILLTKFSKVVECTLFCLLTSSCLYWFSTTGHCQYQDLKNYAKDGEYTVDPYPETYLKNYRGWCPPASAEMQAKG